MFALSLWVGAGCSKPQTVEPMSNSESSATAPVPLRAPLPVLSAHAGTGPEVLTPEDMEPGTERRITEHNLESELDRLEREIQGE